MLPMYKFVSGHFYLPKWAGPTVENTFYSPKKLAHFDRTGLQKIQDGVCEQKGGKHLEILSISTEKVFDIIIAT